MMHRRRAAVAAAGAAGAGGDDGYGDMYGMPGMGPDGRRKACTDEVYFDLREEMLNFHARICPRGTSRCWSGSSTTPPSRARPISTAFAWACSIPWPGPTQLVDRDMDKNNQVILWSPFSEVTKPMAIPRMVYLFAKNVQDKTKTATVEVARYKLGYWRTEDFQVRPGESIGK